MGVLSWLCMARFGVPAAVAPVDREAAGRGACQPTCGESVRWVWSCLLPHLESEVLYPLFLHPPFPPVYQLLDSLSPAGIGLEPGKIAPFFSVSWV